MAEFEVGAKVRCVLGIAPHLQKGTVYTVNYYGPGKASPTTGMTYVGLAEMPGMRWVPDRFVLVEPRRMEAHKEEYRARAARANDPATSKGKGKVNKYEQAVLSYLEKHGAEGGTGKSIAADTYMPLNCITPRFAPLRRKGLIKDSGSRHDKQIVWVLA